MKDKKRTAKVLNELYGIDQSKVGELELLAVRLAAAADTIENDWEDIPVEDRRRLKKKIKDIDDWLVELSVALSASKKSINLILPGVAVRLMP